MGRGWRYTNGIVTAYFQDGGIIEIPVGRAHAGSFYIVRLGESEWRIAPIRFPSNRPESYDGNGHYSGFIHISGASHDVNEEIAKI
jgi:hypothetical protein